MAADDDGSAFTILSDGQLTTANVLDNDNDSDADGDAIQLISFDGSSVLGDLYDIGDGTFTYSAAGKFDWLEPGELAYETFSYTIQDVRGATSTATVTITVEGAPAPDPDP